MKLLNKALLACTASILTSSLVEGKKHYKADHQLSKDHPIVKGTAETSSICMFEFDDDQPNGGGSDKFCQEFTGYVDVGWEWI